MSVSLTFMARHVATPRRPRNLLRTHGNRIAMMNSVFAPAALARSRVDADVRRKLIFGR
jgi:hypothetical protein